MPLESLISPIGSNFIKDWPGQNQVNCDRIDSYAGPCLPVDSLQSYTPELRASTTNPTLGTGGFIRGFYYQIFDQIYTFGEFRFGTSGIAAGTGFWFISLPFTADSSIMGGNVTLARAPIVGNGLVWDDSSAAGQQPVICQLRTNNEIQFGVRQNSGLASDLVNASNNPITWAINDGIIWTARYKRAA